MSKSQIVVTIRALDRFTATLRRTRHAVQEWGLWYRAVSRTHRTGHRHRGTRAWARRSGVKR